MRRLPPGVSAAISSRKGTRAYFVGEVLTVETPTSSFQIELDNQVKIVCNGDLSIEADAISLKSRGRKISLDGPDISLNATGDLSLNARRDLSVRASRKAEFASTDLKVTGGVALDLQSGGMAMLRTGGVLTIQGALVNIN